MRYYLKDVCFCWWIVHLAVTCTKCLEEDQQEIFLSTRNFDPYPYQIGFISQRRARNDRRGPVLFPPNPPDDPGIETNRVTADRTGDGDHPVDNHPYPKVARKYRHKVPGRFEFKENSINPRIREGLALHAAKVLTKPPSRLGEDYIPFSSSDNEHKNYAFSYKVVDHYSGDDFSHTQSQNSKATNGEYRVKLPDGRVQIVSYTADKNGYKADVKYTKDGVELPQAGAPQPPVLDSPSRYPDYDYQDQDDGHQSHQEYVPIPILPHKSPNVILLRPHLSHDDGGKLVIVATTPGPLVSTPVPVHYGRRLTPTPYPKTIVDYSKPVGGGGQGLNVVSNGQVGVHYLVTPAPFVEEKVVTTLAPRGANRLVYSTAKPIPHGYFTKK